MINMSWRNALLREDVHAILKKKSEEREISISDFIKELLIEQGFMAKKQNQEVEATV